VPTGDETKKTNKQKEKKKQKKKRILNKKSNAANKTLTYFYFKDGAYFC